MHILQAPHPVLSKKAKPVGKIDTKVKKLIQEMKLALKKTTDPVGVGLAAPQVGESLRLFIVRPNADSKVDAYINPVIKKVSEIDSKKTGKQKGRKGKKKTEKLLEGCLSLKDIWGPVRRAKEVTVSYMDENGKRHTKIFKGFAATIIQHEYDHLEGILFPKKVLEQKGKLYKSHKNEKGEDEFEELKI